MSTLLGPNGNPISSKQFKKSLPPALGEKYGNWGGEETKMLQLPGGGFLQFNLDSLTLNDFRQMKDNYQINSSLSILTFMLHQIEWHIECDDKKIRDECTQQLEAVWSRLVRAMSQALWAGFSPNVLQWENDINNKSVTLTKIKDLIPEDCRVNWKKTSGAGLGDSINNDIISSKIKVYDGIRQAGWKDAIPVENSFWFPLLMENGDYYGKKLLRPAFQPWFFSILLHLFSNRYFERFGEPTPVGRAPYDEDVPYGGKNVKSQDMMSDLLNKLRNRSVVVLPDDRTQIGTETNPGYDYQIEYLESQMRGADFGQYMTRLDEEMSLALFTPILLMRTADVGSYNLGVGHMQMYQMMLNAVSADWAFYINKYILHPIAKYNSPAGDNHSAVRIRFSKLGKQSGELVRDILSQGFRDGRFTFDIKELSEYAGMEIEEHELPAPTLVNPNIDPNQPVDANGNPTSKTDGSTAKDIATTSKKISARVAAQVENAYGRSEMPDPAKISFGYKDKLARAFREAESPYGGGIAAEQFYRTVSGWMEDCMAMPEEFPDAASYMIGLNRVMSYEVKRLTNG